MGFQLSHLECLGFLASAPADLNPATVSATKKDSVSLCASLFSQLVSGRSLGWSESSKNQGPVLALDCGDGQTSGASPATTFVGEIPAPVG